MDSDITIILDKVGIIYDEIDNFLIPRENLLSIIKYDEIKILIPHLKKKFSSTFMTSLQKNAEQIQKFPLLNLIRQLLNIYNYDMEPIRKCDGYTLDGIKKFKRFFKIKKRIP
jgi:hypothetical protein